MKKILLFLVLAIACTTQMSAQSSFERSLQSLNRTAQEISRLQRNVDEIRNNISSYRRSLRRISYDYNTGIRYKENGSNVFYLSTKELQIIVEQNTIEFFDADGNHITSLNRREYGRFTVATGLTTGVYKNITLVIENDASNTMFQFTVGDRTLMNKWAAQYYKPAPRFGNQHYPIR